MLNLYFRNFGDAPAKNLRIVAHIVQSQMDREGEDEVFYQLYNDMAELEQNKSKDIGKDVGLGESFFITAKGKPLTDEEWQKVQTGEMPLYIVALLKYADRDGQRTTEYCTFYWGDDPNRFIYCNGHNRTD